MELQAEYGNDVWGERGDGSGRCMGFRLIWISTARSSFLYHGIENGAAIICKSLPLSGETCTGLTPLGIRSSGHLKGHLVWKLDTCPLTLPAFWSGRGTSRLTHKSPIDLKSLFSSLFFSSFLDVLGERTCDQGVIKCPDRLWFLNDMKSLTEKKMSRAWAGGKQVPLSNIRL